MSVKGLRYFEPVLDLRPTRGFREETIKNLRWRVLSFEYSDGKGKHNTSSLVLNNYDGNLFDAESMALGVHLKVAFGYPGALCAPILMQSRKMTGAVRFGGLGPESGGYTSAGGSVTLKLHSNVWSMNVQRATSSIEGEVDRGLLLQSTTIPEAVRALARKYGYSTSNIFVESWPDEDRIESSSIPMKFSSYEWIRDLARRRDWIFDVDADGFHFHSDDYEPADKLSEPERLSWFAGEPDVLQWEIDGDLNVPQAVETSGSRMEISNKLFKNSATLGSTNLALFGIEYYKKPPTPSIALTANKTAKHIEKARRILSRSANAWKLKMLLVGNPKVRRGKLLDLYNFGPMIDGTWRVKKSVHKIEPNKVYTTEIEATRKDRGSRGSRATTVKLLKVRKELGETEIIPIQILLNN